MGRAFAVIHLDTNYLVLGSQAGTPEAAALLRWLRDDEPLGTSAVAWMEFVTGPVPPDLVELMRQAVGDRILPFAQEEAELAARLYNSGGRKRRLRYDCMIAAVAIGHGARLATTNVGDFRSFAANNILAVEI